MGFDLGTTQSSTFYIQDMKPDNNDEMEGSYFQKLSSNTSYNRWNKGANISAGFIGGFYYQGTNLNHGDDSVFQIELTDKATLVGTYELFTSRVSSDGLSGGISMIVKLDGTTIQTTASQGIGSSIKTFSTDISYLGSVGYTEITFSPNLTVFSGSITGTTYFDAMWGMSYFEARTI